ncbi:MAG: hypothetical protein OSB43_18560 [Nocardioides sp.]|uniref:hypothetical protein n=1 Tax=Nocardioides sp. TaxID=35761 RepID=UPI0023A36086|nr:hypothetical protein [Nocardioides sp.]MDE0778286.1 hypothetical protein [Nocardioides sp.]
MLFAICADCGAPGSTTTALALAAARGLPAVVVEADPYGGDLALRIRHDGNPLPTTPTVLSVSAGRSVQGSASGPRTSPGGSSERRHRDLWRDGSHALSEHVRVVTGFMAAEHGTSLAWPVLASALEAQTVPVFADLGRIHTGSPSLAVAAAADALVPVCRSDMASVQHMVDRLELLVPAIAERNGRPPIVLPVVIAPRQHGSTIASSVAEILGETAVGPTLRGVSWLAWDPAAVAQLENGADPWTKPLRKSPLMKSARKAMWMVGLATGLSHADPSAKSGDKLGSRRRRRGKQGTQDEPQSWASPYGSQAAPGPADASHAGGQHNAPADHLPPPPPTQPAGAPPAWRPSHAGAEAPGDQPGTGEQNGHANGRVNGHADGRADTQDVGRGRWETAARQERH